jgi:hypothetical protein
MKIRRKFHNWIPRILKVNGITLYPYILFAKPAGHYRGKLPTFERMLKHEYVHINQVRKLGWFRYYYKYIAENFKVGYKNNKFEVIAYTMEKGALNAEEKAAVLEDLYGIPH